MQEQQKKMIENYIQSYNDFHIDGMVMDLDENIVFENISNGELNRRTAGREAFKEQAESAAAYFSQRRQVIESWDFDGQRVSVAIDYHGVLAIGLPNGLQPGDALSLKGESIFEFQNGKIARITDES